MDPGVGAGVGVGMERVDGDVRNVDGVIIACTGAATVAVVASPGSGIRPPTPLSGLDADLFERSSGAGKLVINGGVSLSLGVKVTVAVNCGLPEPCPRVSADVAEGVCAAAAAVAVVGDRRAP
jgi:hypothetical protein